MVGSIAASVASDDDDIQLGLAVIWSDNSNGIWEYRESGSNNWVPFPSSLSAESALLLPTDSWVRFSPSQHFFGESYFRALAWDMTNGNAVAMEINTTVADPYTGPFSTESVRVSITITPVNDPSVIQLDITTVSYTETNPPQPVQIFHGNLQISDVDDTTLVSATVRLECPGCNTSSEEGSGMVSSGLSLTPSSRDMIIALHTPPGFNATLTSDGLSIELVITPLVVDSNSMAYFIAYLQSLHFASTDKEPSAADRTISLSVNDGTDVSNEVAVTVSIELVNDEQPVVTLPNTETTFTEDLDPVLIFTSAPTITDIDDNAIVPFPLFAATIYLMDANLIYESLAVNCSGSVNLACNFNTATGILNITGEGSVSEYEQILGAIWYDNVAEEPDARDRHVSLTVEDGLFTSDPVSLTIIIQTINDQVPVITLANTTVKLQEQETGMEEFQFVRIAPSVAVFDADQINGVFPVDSVEIVLLDALDTNEGLRLTGSPNNTYPTTLTISPVNGLPLSVLQDTLQMVEYFNFAAQPSGSNRILVITVYDNLTLEGVQPSDPVNVTVEFVFLDDPPFVQLMNEVVQYSEGQEPRQVPVSPDAEVGDLDNTEISGLTVSLIPSDPSIDTSQEIISVDTTGSGITLIDSGDPLMLNLSGVATTETYTTVLRTLTYEHTDTPGDPDSGQRTIRVTPLDLAGNPGESDSVIIAFTAVPNPPVVDLNGILPGPNFMATFVEESTQPVSLVSPDFILMDVDSDSLSYVEITLSPVFDDEAITIDGSLAVDVIDSSSSSFIRLQGQPFALIEEFRLLLSSLVYYNQADEPNNATRTVEVVASDGTANGTGRAYTSITIMLMNDQPVLFLNGNESDVVTTYTENGGPVFIAPNPVIVDPDSQILSITVRPEMSQNGDNITGLPYDLILGVYRRIFDLPMTLAEVEALIASLTFHSTEPEPPIGERIYCVSVTDDSQVPSQDACTNITFQPVNDNIPQFEQESYSGSVLENAANAAVVQVTARDGDEINSAVTLTYEITDGDDCHDLVSSGASLLPACRFSIDSLTGQISTVTDSPPDREQRDNYVLTVSVTDGNIDHVTTVQVSITILDVNDNAPRFEPDQYFSTIPLGAQPGYVIANLTILDPDENEQLSLIPTPISGPSSMDAFIFDPVMFGIGRVVLSTPESGVEPGVYMIEIEALDIAFQLSDNRAILEITIISNMEAPQFDQDSYTMSVSELAVVDSDVLTVRATDGDQGSHGEITYSLETEVPFRVNPTTGEIAISSTLDFETQEQYIFLVIATDSGRPSSFSNSTTVIIDIINENEHFPTFTEDTYTATACESVPVGFEILTVLAEDLDAGSLGEVTYDIVPGTMTCDNCVTVNSTTGVVYTTAELDYEQFPTVGFFVFAMDLGSFIPDDEAQVIINILNDNEYPPEFAFNTIEITIPENYPVDNPLPVMFQPLATDGDACNIDQCDGADIVSNISCSEQSGLQYSIESGNEEGLFYINPVTGAVSLAQALDFDVSAHRLFNLLLFVTDGEFEDRANVTIVITDINEHLPMFENATYFVTTPEDTPVGSELLQVVATDQDPTSMITYSLVGENAQHFDIHEITGIVTVAQSLDFEATPEYYLMVVASDTTGNNSIMAILNISLVNINDVTPRFLEEEYMFVIRENEPEDSFIGMVVAEDPESEIQYSIIAVTPGNTSAFAIGQSTGIVTSTIPFDRETNDLYTLTIEARDVGEPSLNSSVIATVDIMDVNDNTPQFSEAAYSIMNIPENIDAGIEVIQLMASDPDADNNGRLSFTIQDGNGEGHFAVNVTSGSLYVASQLDYESTPSYTLVIAVSDSGTPPQSSTVNVEITLLDINDNPPVFVAGMFTQTIPENSPEGTFVVQVQATDEDTGTNAEINFAFEESSAENPFTIDSSTGYITVSNSNLLDRETATLFQFSVLAFNPNDPRGENSTVAVLITLSDENDEVPTFQEETFLAEIAEDFTPVEQSPLDGIFFPDISGSGSGGRYVTTVSAIDRDDGTNSDFTFQIIGGSGEDLFSIDGLSGDVFAIAVLDREVEDFYQLRVQATDMGEPPQSSVAYVNITVTDINDNAPLFTEEVYIGEGPEFIGEAPELIEAVVYMGEVYENRPAGIDLIVQVIATDEDIGLNAELEFSIIGSVPFQINNVTGQIRTTEELDREVASEWTFQVVVRDHGSPSLSSIATVQISVLDENDNPPVISPTSLNVTLLENTAEGTVIETFNISDADDGINAESNVTLSGQPTSFVISNLGVLEVSGLLDYETETEYSFSVIVRNVAPPHFEVIVPVFIAIQNENDNAPMIQFAQNSIPYFEKRTRLVLQVGAAIDDPDGRDVTRLVDGTVEFVNPSPLEPSFLFEPTAEGMFVPYDDYNCPLEDKPSKVDACGFSDPVILTRPGSQLNIIFVRSESVAEDTIIFDASLQEYAIHYGEGVDSLEDSGLSISGWVWLDPTIPPTRMTILAKIGLSNLIYGLFCNSDSSLEFQYFTGTTINSIFFESACTVLQDAWHHLAVVIDNTNASQWEVHVYVDSTLFGSQDTAQPRDANGNVYIGAQVTNISSLTPMDYFNGRIHLLTIGHSVAHSNNIICLTGCGVALISSIATQTPLMHYYNFMSRTLKIVGTYEISVYEEFLNSLIMVIPFTEPRVDGYELAYTVQDEYFNCLPNFVQIPVIAVNDFTPVLRLNGDANVNYVTIFIEEGGPVPVVNQSSFYLTDMDLITFPYMVTVEILDPLQPETQELLQVASVPPGMSMIYEGYVLSLSGMLSLPMFEAVIRTMTYDNTANEPLGDSRQLLFTVTDAPFVVTAMTDISIVFVNDLPVLQLMFMMSEYSEGDGAVQVLESVSISDSDNTTLVSASITFTAPDGELEILSVDTTGSNIEASYDSSTNVLTLEGEDTLESYATVLQSLTYSHLTIMGDPTPGTRVLNLRLFDGISESEQVQAMVFFAAVNDIPVLDLNGPEAGFDYEVTFIEDESTAISAISPSATLIDIDNTSLTYLNASLTSNPDGNLETLLITVVRNEEVTVFNDTWFRLDPSHGTSLNSILQVLLTLQYQNLAEEPTGGIRTIMFIASDGLSTSVPVFTTITVETRNDPPVLDLDPTQLGYNATFIEGGEPVAITSDTVIITDNDLDERIELVSIVIQNALDGVDEMIQSTDPNVTLPSPSLVNSTLSYAIPVNGSLEYAAYLLSTLTYRNVRNEPTAGERSIQVEIMDEEDFSNSEVVNLTVQTVNEHAPMFTQSTYSDSILENLDSGTTVTTVEALDMDGGLDGTISYQIVASVPIEGLTHFQVLPSGVILTTVRLDREAIEVYALTVSATDGGTPAMTGNASVNIRVRDDNDVTPMFAPDTQFSLNVSESRGIGFIVEILVAVDDDLGPNAELVFEISTNGANSPFNVEQNGTIMVSQDLDADIDDPVYTINVIVRDLGSPALSSEASFTITVLDVNDNSPVFTQAEYNESILENLVPPVYILTVAATDADSTTNAEIRYDFVDAETAVNFIINSTSGDIYSQMAFNREDIPLYVFDVQASDGVLTDIATVRVTIRDENDNDPIFDQQVYEGQVLENAARGTPILQMDNSVLQVLATDLDEGTNSEIRYSIIPTMSLLSLELSIDATTGTVAVGEVPADFEIQQSFNFTVIAEDLAEPPRSGTATLVVNILDENDNAPQFAQTVYQAQVPENEPGYSVVTVTADDMDSFENGLVTYTLLNELETFEVDPTSGEVTTRIGLDFESNCFYRLLVLAEDGGTPPLNSTALVEVSVEPLHDVTPVFNPTSYMRSIRENLPAGTSVVTVTATDGDIISCQEAEQLQFSGSGADIVDPIPEYSPVEYSLLSHTNVFTIDNTSGLITTLVELDREATAQYVLTVRATDPGGSYDEANVTVSVMDQNDNTPQFLQASYSVTISENSAVNASVLQVVASDADLLDQGRLVYSLEGNPSFFDIYPQLGIIFVSSEIDFEMVEMVITFTAVVTDTASQFDTASVTITISDVNDRPPTIETQPETQIFTEGQVSLRVFPDITITDPDSFQRLCSAQIDLTTPQIVNDPLVTECSCSNSSDDTTCATGCLEFIQLPEGVFNGTVTQNNNGSSLTLQGNLSIAEYEAAIESIEYINLIFNPLPEDRHVSLYVFDCQLHSNELIQPIKIRLLNVFPPVLNLSGSAGKDFETSFIERGPPVPIVSDSVSITDEDMIREVQELTSLDVWIVNPQDDSLEAIYLPAESALPSAISVIEYTPHNISLSGAASLVDYEASLLLLRYRNTADEPNPTPRTIQMIAHEYFLSSDMATTTVNYITSNDHPPVILTNPPNENSIMTYTEGAAGVDLAAPDAVIVDNDSTNDPLIELQVYILMPTEFDYLFLREGASISSEITEERQSNASLVFTGEAPRSNYETILRNLRYRYTGDEFEDLVSKFIFLQGADLAYSSFSAVQINLEPVNDQMPSFPQTIYSANVPESAAVGYSVVQVVAVDEDHFSEPQIQYSILAGDDDNLFVISPENGTIYLDRSLDFETTPLHRLIVEAEDLNFAGDPGAQPGSTVVNIMVLDINEHVPMFDPTEYNVSVAEGVPVGTQVLQVFASDMDGEEHSQLEFEVIGVDDFIIDAEGIIYTFADIDREVTRMYDFAVIVRNPGNSAFDVAIVYITVLDLNDNPPVLTLNPTSALLREPETTITLADMLLISDVDPNPPSLDFAIVQILNRPDSTPAPGYLLSLIPSNDIIVSGNGTGKLEFTGPGRPLGEYETILRGVVYQDVSEEPEVINRTIAYQVGSDVPDPIELNYNPGETVSNVSLFVVSIELINDNVPQVFLDTRNQSLQDLTLPGCTSQGSYSTIFTEDGPPVVLSHSSLTITDADNGESMIHLAVVEILDVQDSGLEMLVVDLGTESGVTLHSGDSTDVRIVLQGPASAEDFAAVLRNVRWDYCFKTNNGSSCCY